MALCALPGVWLQSASFESAELSALPSCDALSHLENASAGIPTHASELIKPSHAKPVSFRADLGEEGAAKKMDAVHGGDAEPSHFLQHDYHAKTPDKDGTCEALSWR